MKSVVGTVLVVLSSCVFSLMEIQQCGVLKVWMGVGVARFVLFVLFLFLLLCVRVVLVLFMSVGSSSVLFVCVVSNYLLCWGCVLRLCSVKELGSRLFKVPLNPLVVHCSAFWSVLFVFVLICLSF